MKNLLLLNLLVFVIVAESTSAQNTVADLEMTVSSYPSPTSPDGLTGVFSFQFINHGPETAGLYADPPNLAVFIGTNAVDVLPEGPEIDFRALDPANCDLVVDIIWDPPPGEPIKFSYLHLPGPVPPGVTINCPIEYEILPGLDKELPIRWDANAIRTDDPNPANDAFTLIFNAQPRQIPAMTPMGLVAFALALVGAFLVVRRRELAGG